MQQDLTSHFGVEFTVAVMRLGKALVYPLVSYPEEWECVIFAMDLNINPIAVPISFSLKDIRLVGHTKVAFREMFVQKYGK